MTDAPNRMSHDPRDAKSIAAALKIEALGVRSDLPAKTWFTKLVGHYLKKNWTRRQLHRELREKTAISPSDRATRAIRWACAKAAMTGAAAGAVSTAATMVTAQTEGIGGFVAVPLAAAAMAGEMAYRTVLHVDLTCELGDVFDVEFDVEDEDDIWRLYALAFGTLEPDDESADRGRKLVHDVSHAKGEDIGEKLGHAILGESVMRSIVPFVGIVASAVTNVVVTRKLGNTVRRYMRYQRAFEDAFARDCDLLTDDLPLLIEGLWFIFTADGKLLPEEAACLSHLLRKLDPLSRHDVQAHFVEDDGDWTVRVRSEVPEHRRDVFMHALEVAATVDKEVSLPERNILRRVARALGRELDMQRVQNMIDAFEDRGVLAR